MKAKGDGILVHDLHSASGCRRSSRRVNGIVVRRYTPRPPKGSPPQPPSSACDPLRAPAHPHRTCTAVARAAGWTVDASGYASPPEALAVAAAAA